MTKAEKLKKIFVGKTIQKVVQHNSHGEVIELTLVDKHGETSTVSFCTYEGTMWADGKGGHSIPHDICVTYDQELIDGD